jgi:hypothetical protein
MRPRDGLRPERGEKPFVPRSGVAEAISKEVAGIDYTNFESTVGDIERHMDYLRVSTLMARVARSFYRLQPPRNNMLDFCVAPRRGGQ